MKTIYSLSEILGETNKVIANIAAQTNLLAMNAAIEVARKSKKTPLICGSKAKQSWGEIEHYLRAISLDIQDSMNKVTSSTTTINQVSQIVRNVAEKTQEKIIAISEQLNTFKITR